MTSLWITQVALNPMTGVIIRGRQRKVRQMEEEERCEDRGSDQRE